MTTSSPTTAEWRRLYNAAVQVKALAPWTWMEESDLFGIQNPETEEFGFVSVMGMAEEHFAVGVYLGAEGLYQFLSFQQMAPYVDPLDLLQMPQLQASFENRSQLEKQDRDTIKALRFKFRGRHAWPLFRHYHPGLVPWFIDGPQARFLAHALEQLLDVAPRFETNPSLLDHDDIETYLVRVPRKEDDNLTWDDQMMQIPPPELAPMEFELDSTLLDAVRQLPKQRSQIEVDCFMLPMPVGEQGSRPFYPYIVMLVDHGEGMILGFDMLQPLPSVEAMWSKVPDTFLRQLASTGMRPSKVMVCSPLLSALLEIVADPLGFKVEMTLSLPALDAARYGLEAFLRQ